MSIIYTTKKYLRFLFWVLIPGACTSGVQCDLPTEISYQGQIKGIIENQCFSCHAPNVYKKKASRIKIYDYTSLKKMGKSGQLVGSITHSKGYIAMPYRKGTKIDSCSIALIARWVQNGMKKE